MLNSKVIDILKSFSRSELKMFGEFLNSPFHNKNKKAIQLYKMISVYHPDFENKNISKEKLFEKIFSSGEKNKKYNDASLRNLLSDLLILAEEFLVSLNLRNDKFDFNKKLLSELCRRDLRALFEKRLKVAESGSANNEFNDAEDYYKKFLIEELKVLGSQSMDDLKLYQTTHYLNASENLTYYYLIKIFEAVNFFEFRKQYNAHDPGLMAVKIIERIDFDDLLETIRKKSDNDFIVMSVYYRMYKALTDPDNHGNYHQFRDLLFENENKFSRLQNYSLHLYLTNCCVQKIDRGHDEFYPECFGIHKRMFKKDLFSVHPGYFPVSTFTGILHTGLSAKDFDNVENFIHSYSDRLNPSHKESVVNYSMAQLNFYRGNYGKALEYASMTETDFPNFKYHLKILLMKIYYETGDHESVYYTADSFSHFLNKNKIVGKMYRSEFSAFIRILDCIIRYKAVGDVKYRKKSIELLENNSVASKRWLRKKLDEIGQKKPGSS